MILSHPKNFNNQTQSGFGLIEVLIALFILGLVVTALTPIMRSNVWGVENTLARNSARFKAEAILDSLQVNGIHMVNTSSGVDCTEPEIDKRDFSCSVQATDMEQYDDVVVSKRVIVSVSWEITGATKTLSVEGVVQ